MVSVSIATVGLVRDHEYSHKGLAVFAGRVLPSLLRISTSSSAYTGGRVPPTGAFMRRLSVILRLLKRQKSQVRTFPRGDATEIGLKKRRSEASKY